MQQRSTPDGREQQPSQPSAVARLAALVGVVLLVVLAPIGLGGHFATGDDMASKLIRDNAAWMVGFFVVAYVVVVERRPLASIGVKLPTWKTLIFGLAGAVALIGSFMLSYAVIFPLLGLTVNQEAAAKITGNPLWFQGALFLRAAIVEELVYRGYVIERVKMLTRSAWAAGAVSVIAFTAAHLSFWGPAQLIVAGFGAVVLAVLYLWRRDLLANMIAHFLANTVGFLLAAAAMNK